LGKLLDRRPSFSWLIVLPLAAYLTIPGFADIIKNATGSVLGATYTMDMLWGIGGLTYGLGGRKGVSKKAKNAIIAGIAVIVLSIMLVGYGNSLK
jgi:L-rhamnose-H+ transport protein